MQNYNFGKMDVNSDEKVATYFANVGSSTASTAGDIGVSGQFMCSLVNRGYAKIVGKNSTFVSIGRDNLYRKVEVNLYVLTVTASDFWKAYTHCVEYECNCSKGQAERYVRLAKDKLSEVEYLLDKVGSVRV